MVLKAREIIEPALAYETALHGSEADFEEMAGSIARTRQDMTKMQPTNLNQLYLGGAYLPVVMVRVVLAAGVCCEQVALARDAARAAYQFKNTR